MTDVESFAHDAGLRDILPLLRKGAIAAQNPATAYTMSDFDDSDKATLLQEIEKPWTQPRILYVAIILSSIAAAIQGWYATAGPLVPAAANTLRRDQTGSNGANLSFPAAFGIDDTAGEGKPCTLAGTCDRNSWIIGFINSCPYFAIFLL